MIKAVLRGQTSQHWINLSRIGLLEPVCYIEFLFLNCATLFLSLHTAVFSSSSSLISWVPVAVQVKSHWSNVTCWHETSLLSFAINFVFIPSNRCLGHWKKERPVGPKDSSLCRPHGVFFAATKLFQTHCSQICHLHRQRSGRLDPSAETCQHWLNFPRRMLMGLEWT